MRGAGSTRVLSLSVSLDKYPRVGKTTWAPGLGKKIVNHFPFSYLRHDVSFHDVGSNHEEGL